MGNVNSYYSQSQPTSIIKPINDKRKPAEFKHTFDSIRYVCVGINYDQTDSPLENCTSDAHRMEEFLQSRYSPTGIVLTNASRQSLCRALKWLYSSASVQDFEDSSVQTFTPLKHDVLCVFYFAGHGYSSDECRGLVPVTADGQWDEIVGK